jgi:precorrin-6A/cobalt-precorrin-6A reductase
MACAAGRTILLTIGSQHLAPYISEAALHGCRLVARVLAVPESIAACRRAGMADRDVIAARGPFSIEENLSVLRQFAIEVLVTKDSGTAGGLPAKIAAAEREHCEIVLIRRMPELNRNQVHTIAGLLDRIGPRA